MDSGFKLSKDNPKETANVLSKLIYVWMISLFRKGAKTGLTVSDLYRRLNCDSSEYLCNKLEKNWENELCRAKAKQLNPNLIKALSKTFFWRYMFIGIILFVQYVGLRSFQPIVLKYLISLFSNDEDERETRMYVSGGILVIISLIVIFITHHTNFGQLATGMRIRVAVSSLIYRKILRLNTKSLSQVTAGQVVNLLSNDVQRFDMIMIVLHYLWIMPFQVVLVTYLIWQEVGISSLAGVLSMVLLTLPVQGYLGKLTSSLRLSIAQRTDYRVRLMNEIISGIQVIKMYAWEKPFEKIVKMARIKEIKVLTKASYLRGVYLSCMVFVERTTLFLTIVCYVLLGNNISADKVFSMAQFFNLLQLAMAIFYPMAISIGAETLVSIKRLQDFLSLEEKEEAMIQQKDDKQILLQDIKASWTDDAVTLENINVNIAPGKLCAIVGPVGAGKSSILQLLLGELPQQCGKIQIGGNISYSSQEPWLFGSTVRNNILFGLEYDRSLYRKVVEVCALKKDFEQFPQGDKTMVGERGVSLSGGQRARINLARAVYRYAEIYLMDDPLSAVDTHVGRHLFEECIIKYLGNKTRILVTHQLQYLKKADCIIVLNEGKIEAQGTFEELSQSNLDFTKLLVAADETQQETKEKVPYKSSVVRQESVISSSSIKSEGESQTPAKNEEEMITSGGSALKEYLKASGNCCALLTLFTILILGQAACSGADFWVTYWTQQEELRDKNKTLEPETNVLQEEVYSFYNNDTKSRMYTLNMTKTESNVEDDMLNTNLAIYIYTALIIASIIITMLRSFVFFKVAMNASKNLHTKMFHALLQSPMRFFDTNPSGRVLNRFSKDMGSIDEVLPRVLIEAIQIMLVMSGILVMVGITNQYIIIVMVVLGVVFLKLRSWYLATAKDIKHLEGITKSPVFSHLNSSINGIISIRASKAESILKQQFDSHQDVHTSAWFLTITCVVSFGLWLDIVCVIFVACVTFSSIILNIYGTMTGSLAGLAISQSLILTGMLQHGMRQTAEVVNQLTSVERVLQYTTLDKEGPFETAEEKRPQKTWPEEGLVQFNQLYLKYSEYDPPVLKNLNFTVQPGEKIGIVGRTGAGKSSLISALFRLAPIEGNIIIDRVDTKAVGLNDLRTKISIIPQEPVLFSATLRYNLDPFNEFDDKNLWHALEEVELKDAVHSLDYIVSEGGSNFSLGQRQLICLARAIIRNNKILVLDEATANVDPRTDSLIQKTIRNKFQNCTVLTIAHRLNTIMDSNKVLVMDSGTVVEYDHPHVLLQNLQSVFYKMVDETGPVMSQQLHEVAAFAYKNIM